MLEVVLTVLDLALTVTWLVAIPITVLKGRPVLALMGLVILGTGATISFTVFRRVREGDLDDWVWPLLVLQGVAVAGLLAWAATRPARSGSWWDRWSGRRTAGPSPRGIDEDEDAPTYHPVR